MLELLIVRTTVPPRSDLRGGTADSSGSSSWNLDERATAMEAARFLQRRNANAGITVTDVRDGSPVPFERP